MFYLYFEHETLILVLCVLQSVQKVEIINSHKPYGIMEQK